jgi:hypothetical protein
MSNVLSVQEPSLLCSCSLLPQAVLPQRMSEKVVMGGGGALICPSTAQLGNWDTCVDTVHTPPCHVRLDIHKGGQTAILVRLSAAQRTTEMLADQRTGKYSGPAPANYQK